MYVCIWTQTYLTGCYTSLEPDWSIYVGRHNKAAQHFVQPAVRESCPHWSECSSCSGHNRMLHESGVSLTYMRKPCWSSATINTAEFPWAMVDLTHHFAPDFSSLSSYYWPLRLSGIRRRLFHVSVSNLPAVYLGNMWIVSQQPKFTKCYWPWPEAVLEKKQKTVKTHWLVYVSFGPCLFIFWFSFFIYLFIYLFILRFIDLLVENCIKRRHSLAIHAKTNLFSFVTLIL